MGRLHGSLANPAMSGHANSEFFQGVFPHRPRFMEDEDAAADGDGSKITRKRDGCFTCR